MINLLISKCYEFNKFCDFNKKTDFQANNQINDRNINELKLLKHLRQTIISSKLMPKVMASSVESNVDNKENNNENKNKDNVNPNIIKDAISSLQERTVWESIKHQLSRNIDTNDEQYKIQFVKQGETGLDRVKLMWSEWAAGEDNPEVRFIMSSVGFGAIVGVVFGGILGNKTAVQDFMRRHNEYVFKGDFEAKRKIRDSMFLQFSRAGFRLGWRVAFFSGLITGLTTTAIVYRNDVYYTDCMSAGALVCSLWKMKLGLRAMVVSGVVGTVLGFMFAGGVRIAMRVFNTTVPEYRYWRHTRYLGHLTVEKYSDGTTEFDWDLPDSHKNIYDGQSK